MLSSEHLGVSVHLLILKKPPVKIFEKSNLSVAFYFNCVNLPLVNLLGDAEIIEILASIEFHLLSTNINRIYNNFEEYL